MRKSNNNKACKITLRVAWRGDGASESHQVVQKRKSKRQNTLPHVFDTLVAY